MRSGDLKYLSRQDGPARQEWLFDLKSDPAEKTDLSARYPDRVTSMKNAFEVWQDSCRKSASGDDYH